MLHSLEQLRNLVLSAEDGDIGRSKDFLVDDRAWVVRYMVADTGKWLPKRKVLIFSELLGVPDWGNSRIPLQMSKAQLEQAPGLDADAPVSRQYEIEYFSFFGQPFYWDGPALGTGLPPAPAAKGNDPSAESVTKGHLRSTNEISGYRVLATDGEVGTVKDFLVDEECWMVRYLVIDMGISGSERKIQLSPAWLGDVEWGHGTVVVHMTRDQLIKSSECDSETESNREKEN